MFEKREVNYYHFGEVKGESVSNISTFFVDFSLLNESKEEENSIILEDKMSFALKNGKKH